MGFLKRIQKEIKNNPDATFLLLIVAAGNPIWPILSISQYLGFLLVFLLFLRKVRTPMFVRKPVSVFLFFIVFIIVPLTRGFHVSSVFYFICFIIVFNIDDFQKVRAFNYLVKCLSVVLAISFPAWICHHYITPLPMWGIIDWTSWKGSEETLMANYGFFVEDYFRDESLLFNKIRFHSLFDEPGVLGTLSAFVLYGQRYDFKKWYNLLILICSICTFSMAFIVLTVFGYFWQHSSSIKSLISGLVVFLILIAGTTYFLSSNETFQASVVSRVLNFGDDDVQNRNNDRTNIEYQRLVQSSDIIMGYGYNYCEEKRIAEGTSYKNFLLEYGLLGLATIFLAYIAMMGYKDKISIGLLMLFFISFIQRPHLLTSWQIILFSLIVSVLKYNKQKVKHI